MSRRLLGLARAGSAALGLALASSACHTQPPAPPAPAPAPSSNPAAHPLEPADIIGTQVAAYDGPAAGQLGGPRTDLTPEQRKRFEQGRILFQTAFTLKQGLGPIFNETSCVACHYEPMVGGSGDVDRGLRVTGGFTKNDDVKLLHRHAIPGSQVPPEPAGQKVSKFRPPSLFGLGLLNEVSEDDIEKHCGVAEADGVHGHANRLDHNGHVGRFGQTADTFSVDAFVATAMLEEIGLTNPLIEDPPRRRDADTVADPETSEAVVRTLGAFVSGLAPPPRAGRHPEGEALFTKIGCAVCHRADTAPKAPGAYTDLCDHHMGPDLDHGFVEHQITSDEYRTTPLWGLHLRDLYLHDNRAKTLDEAILMHDGEGKTSRVRYATLAKQEQAAVVAFLKTL